VWARPCGGRSRAKVGLYVRNPVLILIGVSLVCLPLQPLFHTAKQVAANFLTPVTLTGLLEFYSNLLLPVSLCLFALLVLLSLLPADPLHETSRKGLRASTLVVLVLFALLPLALFALANSLTGAFLPRYVYASGTAICLLVVYLINRLAVDPHHRLVVLAFV